MFTCLAYHMLILRESDWASTVQHRKWYTIATVLSLPLPDTDYETYYDCSSARAISVFDHKNIKEKWASARQNLQNGMCAQRRLRSAWGWSESSLSAWRKLGSLATHWAPSEDWSDWANESSLGAHAILLVLSCAGSNINENTQEIHNHEAQSSRGTKRGRDDKNKRHILNHWFINKEELQQSNHLGTVSRKTTRGGRYGWSWVVGRGA